MTDHRFSRELQRVQVRLRHASDLLVGTAVIVQGWPDSVFRTELEFKCEEANRQLVLALQAVSNQRQEREEKQEDGSASA